MVETCETQDTLVLNSGIAKRHALQGPSAPKYLLCPDRTVKYSIKAISKHVCYVDNIVTPAL